MCVVLYISVSRTLQAVLGFERERCLNRGRRQGVKRWRRWKAKPNWSDSTKVYHTCLSEEAMLELALVATQSVLHDGRDEVQQGTKPRNKVWKKALRRWKPKVRKERNQVPKQGRRLLRRRECGWRPMRS